ncbi:HupE/UreJ family protein, partial [Pseudomonas aeruginosa]|uniref:HupE/UreJ family protein n=1 Tax=Pseudomonas aeruginosa TaxID=287 RepID=UPI0021AB2E24
MKLPKLLAALALLAAPALAFAHPGHGEHGLVAGLAHPLTGLDHLLAMFAVGLWAAQQQGAVGHSGEDAIRNWFQQAAGRGWLDEM